MEQDTEMEKRFGRRRYWSWIIIIYSFAFLGSYILLDYSVSIIGAVWNWGIAGFFALTIYTVASFYKVGESEIGVRFFFGATIDQTESGPTFAPFGVITLVKVSNLVQQDELPAEPELIYRGGEGDPDGKNIPEGKYPPIRILFGHPEDKNTTDPYDQRMVADVTPVIRYHITDAVKFIKTIGTWENARKQIEDAVVSILNKEFSQMTPAKALKKLAESDWVNEELEKKIDALLKSWGVDLESIVLKPFNFSHDLNEAALEVPKAQREKEAQIIRAQGEKEERKLHGEGDGAAEKARLSGRTDGLKKMAKNLEISGESVLAAETARGITDNASQKTIIAGGGGFKDLITTGTVIAESFQRQEVRPNDQN